MMNMMSKLPKGAMPSNGFAPSTPQDGDMMDEKKKADQTTLPVPLKLLASPTDQDSMVTPEVGDVISIQVDAKVCAINGQMAMICPQAINGQPLDDEEGEQGPDSNTDNSDESEGQSLQADAMSQDEQNS